MEKWHGVNRLKVGPLCLSYNMLIPLKRQCLGLLSLWQCFPLLGILWRKILLLLQTKSPAVWTIGRAFVFRSGSRFDKVFSNISHSYIVKQSIHWYTWRNWPPICIQGWVTLCWAWPNDSILSAIELCREALKSYICFPSVFEKESLAVEGF